MKRPKINPQSVARPSWAKSDVQLTLMLVERINETIEATKRTIPDFTVDANPPILTWTKTFVRLPSGRHQMCLARAAYAWLNVVPPSKPGVPRNRFVGVLNIGPFIIEQVHEVYEPNGADVATDVSFSYFYDASRFKTYSRADIKLFCSLFGNIEDERITHFVNDRTPVI